MPSITAAQVMAKSAALLNDQAQQVYTNTVQLPYLNMSLQELQETFEQNNIPVTAETSDVIEVDEGISEIGFDTTPALPSDLVEIQEVWESQRDQNLWTPVSRRDYLPQYLEGQEYSQFLWYAWNSQLIKLLPSTNDNDLKLNYTRSLFSEITDESTPITVVNCATFLEYRTAGLCARFIGEDTPRADQLDGMAILALDRALGIGTKGQQAIFTRRRPFRASYKNRGTLL